MKVQVSGATNIVAVKARDGYYTKGSRGWWVRDRSELFPFKPR